jgi:multidrug efflux pump subunit AcrB/ABC-type multidrug transport system ATPase subunit
MIRFLVRRPVFVAMLIVGLSLLGVISYTRLPLELLPAMESPQHIVTVTGTRISDPAYIEQHAVIPVESAIAEMEGIERLESLINRNRATIFVYYAKAVRLEYTFLKLQERVAAASAAIGTEFRVAASKSDPQQLSNRFLVFQARGEGTLDQIRSVVDEKITPQLETIDGISSVEVYGGRSRSIEVVLDHQALESTGITAGQVASRIAEQSGKREFLGQVTDRQKRYFVNLVSQYASLPSFGDLVVKDAGPVLLKNIAAISEGGSEQTTISRVNGQEAVSVTLQRTWDSNLISLAHRTRRVLQELDAAVKPTGISLVVQADEAKTIEDNLNSILWLAIIGGLLAVAVLWVFLRNLRLVLIVAVSVPVSILISLNLFYALDITINTLTLVGLAIAIGMLVDNSVVVLENIFRHMGLKKDAWEAVVGGTKEVARAIVSSTLTTVAVFVPFLFSTNATIKMLGRQVGAAIISTLLVSLAVAFLVIPTLSYRILRAHPDIATSGIFARWRRIRPMQIFTVLLKTSLRAPARAVVVALVAFFVSISLCLTLSVNAPREAQLSSFSLYALMPSGMTLEAADEQVKGMDGLLKDIPEVSERLATIQEDSTILSFTLVEDFQKKAGRTISAIKEDILDRLSRAFPRVTFSADAPAQNAQFRAGSGGMGGGSGGGGGGGGSGTRTVTLTRLLGIGASQEKVVVRGSDIEILRAVAEDVKYNLDNLETVQNTQMSVSNQQPSIDLLLDQAALSHFDVGLATVRSELNGFQRETTAGVKFTAGTEEIDIVIKTDEAEVQKTTDDLRRLELPAASGGLIPLPQVAQLVTSEGYANINRVNQEKQVEVTYRFKTEIEQSSVLLEEARASVERLAGAITPPAGVVIEVVRDESNMADLTFLLVLAVVLIYMILASTFEALLTPLVVMFTLPLAGVGAFLALILTSNSIYNANAIIGLLILLGVVVNNAILLIDYSRQLERRGFRRERALMTAGRGRVRPILITAVTTVLGMLPVALGKSEYVSMIGAPFAITVIGGLSLATLLTLVFIPTVSYGLEAAVDWWRGLRPRLRFLQIGLVAAGGLFIFTRIDSFLWQCAYLLILLFGVPACVYFVQASLRHSRSDLLAPGAAVRITVRNITKLYDDFGKFVKEWRKGKLEREAAETPRERWIHRFQALLWQTPLTAFFFYFTYLHVTSEVWILVLAVMFYLLILWLIRFWLGLRAFHPAPKGSPWPARLGLVFVSWGAPLGNLLWLHGRWRRWGSVAVVAVLWYAAIIVYRTSRRLYGRKVNLDSLTGRFRKIRRGFFRLVQRIPVLGRQRVPFQALDRISLDIGSGMFGLVGPNGSGKTTLMRIICGILPASRGKVFFNGLDLARYREELQSLIGYLPQEFGAYESMTARRFLDYQALLKGIWDRDKRAAAVDGALRSVHLYDRRDDRIKTYSGGMKQRLGIAQTLLHLPRVLVVDEPTAGLDPNERIRFRNMLSELARDRIVIFSTHIIEDISSSCNRLAVLLEGRVRFTGTPAELVDLTRGSVWQAHVDDAAFDEVRRSFKVVHHMRDGERIRVRILSPVRPIASAIEVVPNLEDSYMWLLGQEA